MRSHNSSTKSLCREISNWYEYEELHRAHPTEDVSEHIKVLTDQIERHITAHTSSIQAGSNLPIFKSALISKFGEDYASQKINNLHTPT